MKKLILEDYQEYGKCEDYLDDIGNRINSLIDAVSELQEKYDKNKVYEYKFAGQELYETLNNDGWEYSTQDSEAMWGQTVLRSPEPKEKPKQDKRAELVEILDVLDFKNEYKEEHKKEAIDNIIALLNN